MVRLVELVTDHVRKDKDRLVARIQRHLRRDGECLIWTGAKNYNGYSKMNFWYQGRHVQTYVHRLMFVLHTQKEIGEGLEIDHTCNRRDCVNPKHMEAVSHSVNMQRMFERRLSPEEAQQIFDEIEEYYDQAA